MANDTFNPKTVSLNFLNQATENNKNFSELEISKMKTQVPTPEAVVQTTIQDLRKQLNSQNQRVQSLEAGTIEGKIKSTKETGMQALGYLKDQKSKVQGFFGQLKVNAKNGLNSLKEKATNKAADIVEFGAKKVSERRVEMVENYDVLEAEKATLTSELKKSTELEIEHNRGITRILMKSIKELGSQFHINLDEIPELTEEEECNPELALAAIHYILKRDGEIDGTELAFLKGLQDNIKNLKKTRPEGIVRNSDYKIMLERISRKQEQLNAKLYEQGVRFGNRTNLANKLRGISEVEDTQQVNEAEIEDNPFKLGDLGENLFEDEEIVANPEVRSIGPSPSNIVPSEDSNNTPLSPVEILPPESKGEFPVFKILPPAVEASAVPEKTDLSLGSIKANLDSIQVGQTLTLYKKEGEVNVLFKKVGVNQFEMTVPNQSSTFRALEDLAELIQEDKYRFIPNKTLSST